MYLNSDAALANWYVYSKESNVQKDTSAGSASLLPLTLEVDVSHFQLPLRPTEFERETWTLTTKLLPLILFIQ